MREKKVSEAVIHRLPKYYRQLQELQARGVERISSGELSVEMGFNASQIRQDFNCFGGFGQQGYGYQVSVLLREISAILGLTKVYSMIIVGAGNIGKALSRYAGFSREGYSIKAIFDVSPEIIGKNYSGIEVVDVKGLSAFLAENKIDIGVICTQKEAAQSIAEELYAGGVKAIWNFAPLDVAVEGACVENVHLSDSLYVLSYRLANQQ